MRNKYIQLKNKTILVTGVAGFYRLQFGYEIT